MFLRRNVNIPQRSRRKDAENYFFNCYTTRSNSYHPLQAEAWIKTSLSPIFNFSMQVEASSRSLGSRSSLIFADGTKAPLTIVIFIILVAFFPVTQLLSASELLPQIQTKNQASLPLVRTSQSSNYFVLHFGPPSKICWIMIKYHSISIFAPPFF